MALFKIYKGADSKRLTDSTDANYQAKVDGHCYFDTSTGLFYIDAKTGVDENGQDIIIRSPLNSWKAVKDADGYNIHDSVRSSFEGKPLLVSTFTTAADTKYYDAFEVYAPSNVVAPVEPFMIKLEAKTHYVSNGVETIYNSLDYIYVNNLNSMNFTNNILAWCENQSTSYCPVYIKCYYPTDGNNYKTHPIKFCFRNYYAYVTEYIISVYRIPDGFTGLAAVGGIVSTTNYSAGTDCAISSNGLQESGDNNSVNIVEYSNNYMKVSNIGYLSRYGMFGINPQGEIVPFSINYSSSNGQPGISTSRTYYTGGMDWKQGIYYANSETTYAASSSANLSIRDVSPYTDLRYTDNCVTSAGTTLSLQTYKPVYYRGVIKSDGLFYSYPMNITYNGNNYKKIWTQNVPVAEEFDSDGNPIVYWLVGYPYGTSAYQVNLFEDNPLYIYKDEKFQNYSTYLSLAPAGKLQHSLTIGSHVFDGTADVTVPVYTGTLN